MFGSIYQLKGIFYQSPNKENSILEINETFQDANILNARKKALMKFQSYIDVFLDSLGLTYSNDEQASEDLQNYMNSKVDGSFKLDPEVKLDADFDKGLYLYFVPDSSQFFTSQEGEKVYNSKYLIRYIDSAQNLEKNILERNIQMEQRIVRSIQLEEKLKDDEIGTLLGRLVKKK